MVKNNIYNEKVKSSVSFIKRDKYFGPNDQVRNIYKLQLKKGKKTSSFLFGDSIYNLKNNKRPTKDDIMGSLINEYNSTPETYKEFLDTFGYDDTKESKIIYNKLLKNKQKLEKIYSKEELNNLIKKYENY